MSNYVMQSGTMAPSERPRRAGTAGQASPWGGMGGTLLLWITFGALAWFWPATLANLWDQFFDWNVILQVIVGVLLLPWVVATWVWQTDWSTLTRALVIGFLVIGTLISFAPHAD